MGLIAVFTLAWFLVALALIEVAHRALGPVRRERRLWRELSTLLAFLLAFLLTWTVYQALARRVLGVALS